MTYINNPRFSDDCILKAQQAFCRKKHDVKAVFKESPEFCADLIKVLNIFKQNNYNFAGDTVIVSGKQVKRLNQLFKRPKGIHYTMFPKEKTKNGCLVFSPRQLSKKGYSTQNPLHGIVHEFVHNLHFKHNKMLNIKGLFMSIPNPKELSEIGSYALTSPFEFVAEIGAAKLFGRKFNPKISPGIESLYKNLNGPQISGAIFN